MEKAGSTSDVKVANALPLFLVFLAAAATAAVLLLRPPDNLDFFSLYSATRALLGGENPYAPVAAFPPFVYPIWLALLTLPLGALPAAHAALLWCLLNLAMILGAVQLASPQLAPRHRVTALALALVYVPTVGLLTVGQFTAPVLLGAALLARGLAKGQVVVMLLAFVLLSLKPHLGLPFIAGGLGYAAALLPRQRIVVVLGSCMVAIVLLFAGSVVVPGWLQQYRAAIETFRAHSVYLSCHNCASLSFQIATVLAVDTQLVAAGAFVFLLTVLLKVRRAFARPELFVALITVGVLMIVPYLRNYDYILAIYPLVAMWATGPGRMVALCLLAAFVLPFGLAAPLPDPVQQALLPLSTVLLLLALWGIAREANKSY